MRGILIIFLFFAILTSCQDGGNNPSIRTLNKRCAEGKISGEYLVRLKNNNVKKIYASSAADLFLKIENDNLEIDEIDYNFSHKTQIDFDFDLTLLMNKILGIGQYGQPLLEADKLWENGVLGEGVRIAVIDTGLDIENELLSEQVFLNLKDSGLDEDKNGFLGDLTGWDFINNKPLTTDLQGHGTEVTSIISAKHTDSLKIGMAPKAKIIPIAALGPNEDGSDASASSDLLVKAVDYATLMNADIINASWGGNGCSIFLRDSVKKANDRNIMFVTASGNDGENIDVNLEFPSSFNLPFVISVGGIDASSQKVRSSNFGSTVDFFAPGERILTLERGEGINFALVTGTSIAAPFISGSLALLKSAFPFMPNRTILEALKDSRNEAKLPSLLKAYESLFIDENSL